MLLESKLETLISIIPHSLSILRRECNSNKQKNAEIVLAFTSFNVTLWQ